VNAKTPTTWIGANRRLLASPDDKTFAIIAKRYEREIIPGKAIRTQRDNLAELAKLLEVFGAVPIDAIRPQDVRTYLDLRGQTAKVRANRERALLSHIFNRAREWATPTPRTPAPASRGTRKPGVIATSKTTNSKRFGRKGITPCRTPWTWPY
jgi:hypothetical protein